MREILALCAALVVALTSGCSSSGNGGAKNSAPKAAFTMSCAGLRCSFVDVSSDPDGSIRARAWSFGDGFTSADASPVHTYPAPGTYTVTLTLTDDANATGSASQQVTMNLPPRASFDLSCAGLTCTMTDGSTDSAGSIASRAWTFGDGTASADQDPIHTYASAGTYSIALTVTDEGGLTDTTSRTVTVTVPVPPATPPTAAFDVTCSSQTCTFTDRSSDAVAVTSWSWSFGDGSSSTVRAPPPHTYAVTTLTEFTVQLTVANGSGETSTTSRSFTVSPPAGLSCRDAQNPGELVSCNIVLDHAATLQVELTARECMATGNTLTVTAPIGGTPVTSTLFTDGCYDPPLGTIFTLSDNGAPFPAGTVISAHMSSGSQKQVIPPTLLVIGTASPWEVQFDDGQVAPADLDLLVTFRTVP